MEGYQPQTREEMQDAIRYIFGPMLEAMLQGEMDSHLGYCPNDHEPKNTENRRNGYGSKILKSTYGDVPVDVPRDRQASFEPQSISGKESAVPAGERTVQEVERASCSELGDGEEPAVYG